MTDLVEIFIERGDLAHLALLLWAASASGLAWFALRELAAASRRFDDFVRELARFNERCEHEWHGPRRRRRKEGAPVSRSPFAVLRSEEHTSELQSRRDLVCRLLLEKKNE